MISERALGSREATMDVAYKNALNRRDAIMGERDKLDREIDRINNFLDLYREFGGEIDVTNASATNDASSEGRAPRGSGARMLDAAEAILRERQDPMPRADLLNAVESAGVVIGGKDPAATLASALWRDKDRFVNIKGRGYWLRDRIYSDAHYYPDLEEMLEVTDGNEPNG